MATIDLRSIRNFYNLMAMESEYRKRHLEWRMKNCVPWTPNIKWQPELNLIADTYKVRNLFDVEPISAQDRRLLDPCSIQEPLAKSMGKWTYLTRILPAGTILDTWYGREIGSVVFDGDVVISCLHSNDRFPWERPLPWMSLTPAEILSLRSGTRLAQGSVIVAGLGLGHQLIEVSLRKKVKKLTLVEIDRDLIDFIMPAIKPMLGMEVDVICGDAYEVIPKMRADIALLDIFAGYGGNKEDMDRMRRLCQQSTNGIGKMWAWGSQYIRKANV